MGGRGDRMDVLITWIAYEDLIYQISAAAGTREYAALKPKLEAVAQSFHAITDEERAQVRQDRLRIATARPGEDLAALSERTSNRWSVAETAIANGLDPDAEPPPGMLIKISVSEPYVAPERKREPSGPEEEDNPSE